ncbi:AtrD-1 [Coleophoma cylindrospora]|uniref:AtrD-1 n=1 Tax=Coleophoma cylindrospora TaxID=1849047 RepID=A0A3D8RMQ9_9HELO|nr:AtrD-1 [Coleophoma cylindrospora]
MASQAPWVAPAAASELLSGSGEKRPEGDKQHEINTDGNHFDMDEKRFASGTQTADTGTSTIGSTDEEEKEITKLARAITEVSIKNAHGEPVNPFLGSDDPALNPSSGKFSAKAWAKALLHLQSRDPERYPERTAGISYKNLAAHGFGEATDYQKTFGNYPLELGGLFQKLVGRGAAKSKIQILRDFDGLVRSGEMLVVLGRPGSGCSTLLKTIAGETDGYFVDERSEINYQGIPMEMMHNDFRGECIYQAEVDVHFPQLTVGQTLMFAAEARAPRNRIPGITRKQYAAHMRDVIMAIFGLSHTINTKVGNDFIRGVSGGERKRVSIAEAALGGSPLQCWDNSTRGLDSATALEFVRTLRHSTEVSGSTAVVAIYQASQSIYDVFDKVAVLYEGRQIYFGNIHKAKEFFVNMGFDCPERQTTADYLTSLTSPAERIVRPGFENKTPFTPDEFAAVWQKSEDRAELLREIDAFNQQYPIGGQSLQKFQDARRAAQAKRTPHKSPFTISVPMQIKLCVDRGFQRLHGDMSLLFTGLIGNSVMSLVVASVFYNLPNNTGALYSRGALLFFAILLNAFASSLEILTLYAQRPIVEKHKKYAFYHPFAEAVASMICDMPNKISSSLATNIILYFMTNLRREPANFFIFYLFSFLCVLCMSMIFRTIASVSRTLSQAMAPAALLILALVIYTGFTIPTRDMHPWFRWINYLDPVAYAFEALMVNEFHNRKIPCSVFIPSYPNAESAGRICSATGAVAGSNFLDGDTYLHTSFEYSYSHLWRNFGILVALTIFMCAIYLTATEYISAKKSKGEVLLFPRTHIPKLTTKSSDEEANADDRITTQILSREKTVPDAPTSIQKQTAIFHWNEVNYDIKIKNEPRRLLDGVDGWVRPGTLTALMGVSGAGKTTLLDVLASRVTMGVVTGDMLVDGHPRGPGFQRATGYVQQQDLHLATSTVREALNFSALLRQPKATPRAEKLAYVDEVIKVLEMESYADAVVGVPGEGLNVEQRKRLTIGVEMAAKPALLLFLDEPTSGLDSQTAWSICALLRKLADNGQAILCTIHQPSAILFQEFDRLLFLARGGRTVYFGEIGPSSKILTDYFARNGARPCGVDENPAEWMLEVIGAAPGSETSIDWPIVWNESPERAQVRQTLAEMRSQLSQKAVEQDSTASDPFAAPFGQQLSVVLIRVFEQYWRTPSYLYSKFALCLLSSLFIGFSFYNAPTSLQGLQNQMFSMFMLLTIFGNLVQQIMPHFVTQRALYEVRERPSKTYSWQVFMLSNIIVELPWNSLMAVLIFVCWYYPIGMYRNAQVTGALNERSGLMFLFIWTFLLFTSTFTNMVIAGMELAETAGNLANLAFSLCLIFCGVLAGPSTLPGFWIFMYRVSPFTYLVSGVLSVGVANTKVVCSSIEYLHFDPPSGETCATYMAPYISAAGGYLTDATKNATSNCAFCTIEDTNVFLASVSSYYSERWRNFGLMWVYIIVNAAGALFFYWLNRVPKKAKAKKE